MTSTQPFTNWRECMRVMHLTVSIHFPGHENLPKYVNDTRHHRIPGMAISLSIP